MAITDRGLEVLRYLERRTYIDNASIRMVEYSREIHSLHDAGYLTHIIHPLCSHYVITDMSGKYEREAVAYAAFSKRMEAGE